MRSRSWSLANPLAVFEVLWVHRALIGRLAHREVLQRYRGSTFGLLWSLFHPLLMLAVFTFVFGTVLPARGRGAAGGTGAFGVSLFAGLIAFWMLAECLSRAPGLVLENPAYVKRVVFPLEILPWVVVASALFHSAVSCVVLVGASFLVHGSVPASALALPLVLLPIALLGLGACWFFSALGVYVRDLQQVMPVLVTSLLFVTPIFYSSDAVPESVRGVPLLNPLASVVEQARAAVPGGMLPDWGALAVAGLVGWGAAWLGLAWFARTRRGFADVV